MNIKILQEKQLDLLKRKEITALVESPDKTPTNRELKAELASKFNVKENLIVIKQINQTFGKKLSKVLAYIYKDEKSLKEIEPVKKERKVKEEKQVPAEQKKETSVEKPKEEVKQQPKPEVKPEEEKKE